MTTYNGWTNYETWAVALWMDNDQGMYNYARYITDQAKEDITDSDQWVGYVAEMLEQNFDENKPELTGVYADLFNSAATSINWFEIAEHLLGD